MNFNYNAAIFATSILAITTAQACAAHLLTPEDDQCVTGDCLERYFCSVDQCNATFDPGDLPPSDATYQDILDARAACKDGADIRLSACDTGTPTTPLVTEWFTFLDDLARCRAQYGADGEDPDPQGLADCYQAVTNAFRARVNDIPDPAACTIDGEDGALYSMPFHSAQSLTEAALLSGRTDGRYPVSANTTLSFTAGFRTTAGSQYDVRQFPCIKRAAAIAIYQTKTGVKVEVVDVDMNTFDGTSFDIQLIASNLIDTEHVDLVCVYFDGNSIPVLGEIGLLDIMPSPIQGDWNRDEVLTPQDITDFLDSYTAQTNRADLNNDGQVDEQDAAEFTGTSPE